jgi:fatty-acyl-CoA synthase
MMEAPSGHKKSSSIWLPGGEPAPGRIARAVLRSQADIRELEKVPPEALLPGRTIYECIKAAAALDPTKPAITHLLSADIRVAPRVVTYAELVDLVERTANLVSDASAGNPASTAVILPMLPEGLIASWAASTVGVVTPINPYLEMRYVISIMNAARTTVLVTTTNKHGPGAWDNLRDVFGQVPTLRRVLIVDSDDRSTDFLTAARAFPAGEFRFAPVSDPDQDVTYLLTGGTTAAPKLIRMTHRGQLLNAWMNGALQGMEPTGVMGHAMPNFHVGGYVVIALRTIILGQTLLTLTTDGFRNADVVRRFWDIARRYRMTSALATPTTAAAILDSESASAEGHCIKAFGCGGSTVPVELTRAFHKRFGVWLREQWGQSEAHGTITGHLDNGEEPVTGSIGYALPYHAVKAIRVDEKNRFVRECEPGERGVIAIEGPGLTPGYVDARLDESYFVAGAPEGRKWGNSGDLGTLDARGYAWIFGRSKDLIIRGGHNIDPKLIEDALSLHPAIQVAAAIGRPDAQKGEMPMAYVQLKSGESVAPSELMRFCREHVQERAAAPVEIVILDQMPQTPVGKISKPKLRMDAMQRVANEVATKVLEGRGRFDVVIDESGLRPAVVLNAAVNAADVAHVASALREAFRNYEFATTINVA